MKTEFQRKKGFVYTLEVLITVSIVIVAAAMVFQSIPEKSQTELATLKEQGFRAVKYLDDTGYARNYANQNNESFIEAGLAGILSSTVNFEAEICGTSCSDANVPASKDVLSIDYYISGYRDEYMEKRVKLWIWKK